MNKSKYINPKNCVRCGRCCKSFSIVYPKDLKDKIVLSEVQRFKELDTDTIIVTETKEYYKVTFNFECKYLKLEDEVGYICLNYGDNRPELCKQYPYKESYDCPFHTIKEH